MDDHGIEGLINEVGHLMVSWRQDIHRFPEIAFEEYRTSNLVGDVLTDLGLEVTREVAGTGVIGLLRGVAPGPTIAIRVDMDALAIHEETRLPFASRVPGVMHACGHDGHVAIGLGTAMVLSELRNSLSGQVKFVFQPAEETLSGAKAMLDAGTLQCPDVDAMIALHLWPGLSCGKVQISSGTAMASADRFTICLRGPGGHVASPHKSIDVINEAAVLIGRFQSIVGREIDPSEPVVIGVGRIEGGTMVNSIPEEVKIYGTVRATNADLRARIQGKICASLRGLHEASGVSYDLDYQYSCPPLTNDPNLSRFAVGTVRQVLGETGIVYSSRPTMVAEDFAYFAQHVPALMMFLGAGEEPDYSYPLHHSRFNFHEGALQVGARILSETALAFLSSSVQ